MVDWCAVRARTSLLLSFVLSLSGLAVVASGFADAVTPPIDSTASTTTDEPIPDPAEPELRAELIEMAAMDQAVRTGIAPLGDDRTADELFALWDQVDAANSSRMEEVLDECGWPGFRLVGRDGASAAWLLIQHADLRPELQARGLVLMATAVEAGDADSSEWAYLVDRVRVGNDEPQLYGTQWRLDENGAWTPTTPIENEDGVVDQRRSDVGPGTLDEYRLELEAAYEMPDESAPASTQ